MQRFLSKSRHTLLSFQHLPSRSRHVLVVSLLALLLVLLVIFPSTWPRGEPSGGEDLADLASLQAQIETLQRRFQALAVDRKLLPADSLVGGSHLIDPHVITTPRASTAGLPWGKIFKQAHAPPPPTIPPHPANSYDFPANALYVPQGPASAGRGLTADEMPSYRVGWADCARLFAGDGAETERAREYGREKASAEAIGKAAQNCPLFIGARKYMMRPVSAEEAEFSIAFSIIMHAEVEHFERLLRAIYRPQNHYCIHVDSKAALPTRQAVEAIVSCFTNVFITGRSVDVQWAKFSIVEPELLCMEELLARSKAWKYFINLTGQEWPLKTNLDIVRILRAFNGSNNMEGTVERRDDTRLTNKPPPPVPVTLTKGSVHVIVTREFCRYVLYNKDAIDFREWVKDTYIPDETFFSSLNHSPQLGVPGAYLGKPETDSGSYMFIARFKNWGDGPFNWPCSGQRVRYICVFGVGDLPLLASHPEIFANKFYADFEPATLDCMEELHYNRTRDEALGVTNFDVSFYKALAFVKHHV